MLHQAGDSRLHRANPLTKIALVFACAAMLPLWPASILLLAATACAGLAIGAGFGRRYLTLIGILTLPIGVALLVVHGLLIVRGPPQISGIVDYYPDGVGHAVQLFTRIILLLAASLLFVMSTRPSDLARSLDGAGMHPAFSYLLVAPLALIEAVNEEVRLLGEALASRGLSRQSLRDRLHGMLLLALLVPRCLVGEVSARASALETRGFRALPRRHLIDEHKDSPAERRLRRTLLFLACLQFAWSLA